MPTCIAAHSYSQSFWSFANTPLRGQALIICVIVTTPLYTHKISSSLYCQVRKPPFYTPIEASLLVSNPASISARSIFCAAQQWTSLALAFTGIFTTAFCACATHTLYLRNPAWPLNSNRLTVRQELFHFPRSVWSWRRWFFGIGRVSIVRYSILSESNKVTLE